MRPDDQYILTINGGSSSIKFSIYSICLPHDRKLFGMIDRIGMAGTMFTYTDSINNKQDSFDFNASDHKSAAILLIDWLEKQQSFVLVAAAGHRVVHGMYHLEPVIITGDLMDELHHIEMYDPDHMPGEIELIRAFSKRYPDLPQVACFDTAFHSTMPRIARLLPVPRRYEANGVQRYGFHGLSYSYLMEELTRLSEPKGADRHVILAHLGSGSSMAAVFEGHSIDTSMSFTPAAGLMMGTRSGDLDPGLISYLARNEQMTCMQFDDMINHKSGLLGVSETSSDMRDLLAKEKDDIRAREAIDLFCYLAKKQIGAYAAALGGLDTLVFSGGIGENSPSVRERICAGLGFLGIELEESANFNNKGVISKENSRATIRVIRTNEELMIARSVCNILDHAVKKNEI